MDILAYNNKYIGLSIKAGKDKEKELKIKKRKYAEKGINAQVEETANFYEMFRKLEKEDKKITNAMISELKDKYSRVCYFSPGMYYTQGAVFHVVLKMQMKMKELTMYEAQYYDSMLENISDIVNMIEKYQDKDFKSFMIKSSKYF